jgi:hypothetical protein
MAIAICSYVPLISFNSDRGRDDEFMIHKGRKQERVPISESDQSKHTFSRGQNGMIRCGQSVVLNNMLLSDGAQISV